MKKVLFWLVIGLLAGAIGGYFVTDCRDAPLKRENAALKEEISVQKLEFETLEKFSAAKVSGLLEQIGGLQGNIDSLMFANVGLENALEGHRRTVEVQSAEIRELRTAEVEELMERYPALRAYDLAKDRLIETKDKMIFTLVKQVETWKDAFANSEKKYQAQVEITGIERAQKEAVKALLQKVETRLSLQDRRVALLERRQLWTVGSGALVVVAVVLVSIL
jgi:uncharacterized protein YneF (UPF0154 family)